MSAQAPAPWAQLPGGEYLAEGLAHLACQRESVPSLLLAIASTRLAAAGLPLPPVPASEPELRLYRLLRSLHGDDAHSQYNAHLRRLSSLCFALEMAASSHAEAPPQPGLRASFTSLPVLPFFAMSAALPAICLLS